MYFLGRILELLQEHDSQEIFADPVDTDEVPDYLDMIKKPMDFSTMRNKMENFEYCNIDVFEEVNSATQGPVFPNFPAQDIDRSTRREAIQ